MSLIPEDALVPRTTFNFAPMVDFLFILIALFALAAASRKAIYDSQVMLVHPQAHTALKKNSPNSSEPAIQCSVSMDGTYKWLNHSSNNPFRFKTIESLKEEIRKYKKEAISPSIHLHIDKKAPWDPIAQLILAMYEENISVYPIYENKKSK